MEEVVKKKPGKRERTRTALLESALDVIAQKGVEGAKINEITDNAGMANGTFYNHFDDKEQIIQAVAIYAAEQIGGRIDAEMAHLDKATARMVTATTKAINLAIDKPVLGLVLIDLINQSTETRNEMMRFLKLDLKLGQQQGEFDIELSQFLLDQVVALITASMRNQITEGIDAQKTARTCDYILRLCGLTPKAAARAVEKTLHISNEE
ncbi:MAG: TetR/AcrR family transcriptional regulator [Pseudomonadota bacterium]